MPVCCLGESETMSQSSKTLDMNEAPPKQFLLGHLPIFMKNPLDFLTHCARNYGTVVPLRLLHIPAFLLLDPADIERVLVTEHRDFTKPAWLRTPAVLRLLGDGLVTSDGDAWKRQRHACQPAFHSRRMEGYGESILEIAEMRMSKWEAGQTLDLQGEMTQLTLAIAARTLLGAQEMDWTAEAGAAMDTLMVRFTAGASLYGMIPIPPGKEERRATQKLDSIIDMLIQRHDTALGSREKEDANPDLLTLLQKPDEGKVERQNSLREQVKTFLAAGYESSALTLTWAFLLLAKHTEVEAKLMEELREVLENRTLSPPDLPRLVYAQAIIQETLRLYPPLWMTGRQSANRCEIGGHRVPKGALIMTSQWAVHRLPRYFSQPDEFRPERWLNGETEGLPRFAYFPFGGGPRICIAQHFAMMESVLLLAAISRRYRLEPVGSQEILPWATMTLRPSKRIQARLKRNGTDQQNA